MVDFNSQSFPRINQKSIQKTPFYFIEKVCAFILELVLLLNLFSGESGCSFTVFDDWETDEALDPTIVGACIL